MEKTHLNKLSVSPAVLLWAIIAFAACSKDKPSESPNRFEPTDFTVSNIETTHMGSDFIISYDVKNTTNMDYDFDMDGGFSVRFTISTTDGAQYEGSRLIPTTLSTGTTSTTQTVITISSDKTPDLSTLKHEIIPD